MLKVTPMSTGKRARAFPVQAEPSQWPSLDRGLTMCVRQRGAACMWGGLTLALMEGVVVHEGWISCQIEKMKPIRSVFVTFSQMLSLL